MVGDPPAEQPGWDGLAVRHHPARVIPFVLLAGCASFTDPDPTNLATYCTSDTGYRVGYLSKAYYGVCPKETEGAFLAGLERGRGVRPSPPQAWPYFDRMERTEREIRVASSDAQRADLRKRLSEIEWQAEKIVNDPASYAKD
jgi:hypothetical protein